MSVHPACPKSEITSSKPGFRLGDCSCPAGDRQRTIGSVAASPDHSVRTSIKMVTLMNGRYRGFSSGLIVVVSTGLRQIRGRDRDAWVTAKNSDFAAASGVWIWVYRR